MSTTTVLLITNIPTPYRIPLFNEMADVFARNGLELTVVFGASGYERRAWSIDMKDCRFGYEILESAAHRIEGSESVSFSYRGLWGLIWRLNPEVTIVSGFSTATVKVWLRRIVSGSPYVIWSGAIEGPRTRASALRVFQRRLLVRFARAYVAYGSRAKRYLETLGADTNRISIGINTVDTKFYQQKARSRPLSARTPEKLNLVCLGDLSARKRVDLAIKAVSVVAKTRRDVRLQLVGDGPERESLELLARQLGVHDLVQFEGFRQKDQVADILSTAHCLLFPTGFDVWGLVLVEAMAAGVPCIASNRAGATADLIRDGVTGFAVEFGNSQVVADKILWMLEKPEHAKRLGTAASEFVETHVNLAKSAEGFLEAATRALSV